MTDEKEENKSTGSATKLAAAAGVAIVLAVGVYVARSYWSPEQQGPVANLPPPVDTSNVPKVAEQAVGKKLDAKPADAPVLGVGPAVSAAAPGTGTVPIKDGRAVFGLLLPRKNAAGNELTAYQVSLGTESTRLWAAMVTPADLDKDGVTAISLNPEAIRKQGADLSALTVTVSAGAPEDGRNRRKAKFERIGLVRLALQ